MKAQITANTEKMTPEAIPHATDRFGVLSDGAGKVGTVVLAAFVAAIIGTATALMDITCAATDALFNTPINKWC